MSDGLVRNPDAAEQGKDFSGMIFGSRNISPTDIDGFLDVGGLAFILIELKRVGASFTSGQKWAYERLVDACEHAGIPSVVLVGRHTTPLAQKIPVASCVVSEFRMLGQWRAPHNPMLTVREASDLFLEKKNIPWHCDDPPVHQAALVFDEALPSDSRQIHLVRRSTAGS